jgi:hypothetical protein
VLKCDDSFKVSRREVKVTKKGPAQKQKRKARRKEEENGKVVETEVGLVDEWKESMLGEAT